MIVTITLTSAGPDTGPFNLYSDVDGFVSAFETGVSKAALLAGYTTSLVPNGTTIIRVMSNSALCTNYIDITISGECTTTTSTSSTTTTSTSTTTTTTTEAPPDCTQYDVVGSPSISIEWFACSGEFLTQTVGSGGISICAETGTVVQTGGSGSITPTGPCGL